MMAGLVTFVRAECFGEGTAFMALSHNLILFVYMIMMEEGTALVGIDGRERCP